MRASDVMTSNLATVGEDASVRDVALVLLQNQISAVPVIDRMGNMIGIVSDGDLMRRPGSDPQKRCSWWLEFLSSEQAIGEGGIREDALAARDRRHDARRDHRYPRHPRC